MDQVYRAVADAPGQVSRLSLPSTVIGRRKDCDLVVGDSGTSKTHCRIDRAADQYTIVDLDSQNGTFVNEEKVSTRLLVHGDRLRIGYSIFDFTLSPGGEAVLAFVKRVKPASAARQAPPTGGAGTAAGNALDDAEEESPWVDAASGAPLPSGAPDPHPEPPNAPGELGDAGSQQGLGDDDASRPPALVQASASLAPDAAPRPPETPRDAMGDAHAAGPQTMLVALIACAVALAAVMIFSAEIRSLAGLKQAEPLASRQPDPPVQAAERTAAIDPGAAAASALKPLLAEIESLRSQVGKIDRLIETSGESRARIADLDMRLAELEKGADRIERFMSELREAAKAAASRQAAAAAEKPKTDPPQGQLSPEEALFRDVMEALEKKE